MDLNYNLQNTHIDTNHLMLSPIGILSLDIIIKEFFNISSLYFATPEYSEVICSNISDYLENKETYLLSYSAKKAIEIIKLEYIYYLNCNTIILNVIKKQLCQNIETPFVNTKGHKRHQSNLDTMQSKKRNIDNNKSNFNMIDEKTMEQIASKYEDRNSNMIIDL